MKLPPTMPTFKGLPASGASVVDMARTLCDTFDSCQAKVLPSQTEVAMAPEPAAVSTTAAGAGPLLRLLLDGQPRTRAELIELTGLARSTVAARIEALVTSGLVVPSGEAASTGGRPPARFAFNPAARVILVADVGATHLSVALTDLSGDLLGRVTVELNIA